MNALHYPRNLVAATVLCAVAVAQTPRPGDSSLELMGEVYRAKDTKLKREVGDTETDTRMP